MLHKMAAVHATLTLWQQLQQLSASMPVCMQQISLHSFVAGVPGVVGF